ncbi:MAG: hypothetical protein Q8867_11380, partial [Bacteroidota bacterium]|nr:hypothetical protein [Bacteroidota bacterium]
YRNGKKNGIKSSYLDKEIIRENFRNDIKEGFTRIYYADSILKEDIPFVKGLEQGIGKEYSKEGSIITLIEYKKGFVVDRIRINRRDRNNLKQGKWFTFYDNGQIHEEGTYRDDKKDGYFKEFAQNGDLISVSKYINDIKQEAAEEVTKLDVVQEYYPDGKIRSVSTYRKGVPEGIRREYSPEGIVIKSLVFQAGARIGEGIIQEDGTKDGHWVEFFSDSTIKSEGNYKDGKPLGEWKYFYTDGKIEQTGKYSNSGKLTGIWKWFYNNGRLLREEEYLNGLRDGIHREYDEEGNETEEGEYVKGLEDGPWFSICGDYMERGSYRDGLKTGKWTSWNLTKNGNVTDSTMNFTGNFIDDNPDGKHVYYWDNGKIKSEGSYIMGKKEGNWILNNYDGTPFLVITYRNGIETRYDGVRIKPPFEAEEP